MDMMNTRLRSLMIVAAGMCLIGTLAAPGLVGAEDGARANYNYRPQGGDPNRNDYHANYHANYNLNQGQDAATNDHSGDRDGSAQRDPLQDPRFPNLDPYSRPAWGWRR